MAFPGGVMADGVVSMSVEERDRSHLVRAYLEHRVCQRVASERLGISVRQFKRLVRWWKQAGDAGLVSRQRGRPSNNRLADDVRARISGLLRDKYPDFGPTLAAEKLVELEGIKVSAETIRQTQVRLGLWKPKTRRAKRVFQVRERRLRFGELIQIDGSPHDWFEGRAPRCTLIVFIDDATNRLTALRFAPAETTRAYLETLRSHVLEHGRPLAFYSDRHGIFRVNAKDSRSGDGKTEFGRVAERLGITPTHALTPQAKGRVERANQTSQDRLVKEMRLRGIASIEAANAFLPTCIATWNEKFAVPARCDLGAPALDEHPRGVGRHPGAARGAGSVQGADVPLRRNTVLRQDHGTWHRVARGDGDGASFHRRRDGRALQGSHPAGDGLRDIPSSRPGRG